MRNGCLLKQTISHSFFQGCYAALQYILCAVSNMMQFEHTGTTPINLSRTSTTGGFKRAAYFECCD